MPPPLSMAPSTRPNLHPGDTFDQTMPALSKTIDQFCMLLQTVMTNPFHRHSQPILYALEDT